MIELQQKEFTGEVTEEMVNYVRKLVRAKCRVRPVPNMDPEDVEQVALEETVKYIHKFDPTKAPLSGFLAIVAASAVGHARRYCLAGNRWNNLQPVSYEESALETEALNYLDRRFASVRFKVDLLIHAGLDKTERKIALMLYNGCSRREISSQLGIPEKLLRYKIRILGEKYLRGENYNGPY